MEEKFFCLISGIEGPSGLPMLNSRFFPLGKSYWREIIAVAVLGGGAIAVVMKITRIF